MRCCLLLEFIGIYVKLMMFSDIWKRDLCMALEERKEFYNTRVSN